MGSTNSVGDLLTNLKSVFTGVLNASSTFLENVFRSQSGNTKDISQSFTNTAANINWGPNEKRKSVTEYDNIYGLPPAAYYEEIAFSKVLALNSMLVVELMPGWPQLGALSSDKSLNIYAFDSQKGQSKYQSIFQSISAIKAPSNFPLKFAVINDFSIQESWSTEYGESMFENIASGASQGASEVRYATGIGNMQDMADLAKTLGEKVKGFGGSENAGTGAIGSMLGSIGNGVGELNKYASTSKVGGLGAGVVALATGSKVDFPMIWKGSNYKPSYSFTVRLYNPFPSDDNSFIEYIVKPLTYLLAFMTPLTDSPYTFSYPVLCSVKCPGLFQIKAGYVSSIDVRKGGENSDISFEQRPGTVDVSFVVEELYGSMVAKDASFGVAEDRPTLDGYVSNLLEKMQVDNNYPPLEQSGSNIAITSAPSESVQYVTGPGYSYQKEQTEVILDDKLGLSRSSVGVTEADAVLNVDNSDINYNNYLLSKSSLANELEEKGLPYREEYNVALLMKFNLLNDENLSTYFLSHYDLLRDEYTDKILGENPTNISGAGGTSIVEDFVIF